MSDSLDLQPGPAPSANEAPLDLQPGPVTPAPPSYYTGDVPSGVRREILSKSADASTPLPENEDLGVVPMPPAQNDAALAAHKATTSGIAPDAGLEALQRADTSGQPPDWIAKNLPLARAQEEKAQLQQTLATAPITTSWMNQSPTHAAVGAADADNLTTMEWLFGKYNRVPTAQVYSPESYATAGIDYPLPTTQLDYAGEPVVPSAIAQYWAKAFLSLKATWIGLQQGMCPRYAPGPDGTAQPIQYPKEQTDAEQADLRYTQELAAAPVPGTEGHIVREAVGESVGAVPQMLGLMAAPIPFLWAQMFGDLHNHFSQATKPDGTPKYTEDQARLLSVGGATATAALFGGVGSKLATGTIGRLFPKAAQGALGDSATEAMLEWLTSESSPLVGNLQGRALQLGQSAMHGLGFMVGQSIANDLTDQAGELITGGRFDPGKTWEAAKNGAKGAAMLLPMTAFAPALGAVHDIGRAYQAHGDALDVGAQIEAAKDAKSVKTAPDQVQPLVDAQGRQDASRGTAYVPVAAFEDSIRAAGHEPGDVAASLTDEGAAYQEAKASGGHIAIPMSDVLTKLAPAGLADSLLPDIKLDPEGMTLREAQQFLNDHEAAEKSVFNDYKLRALAAGEPEDVADANAKIFAKAMTRFARGEGRSGDVRSLYEKMPVALVGPDGTTLSPEDLHVAVRAQAELQQLRLLTPGPRTLQEVYSLLRDHFAQTDPGESQRYETLRAAAEQEAAAEAAVPEEAQGKIAAAVGRIKAMLANPDETTGTAAVLKQVERRGPAWYSQLERAAVTAKQAKGTPESWLAVLAKSPGVKAEEVRETGVDAWLKEQRGTVSRDQVAEYIRQHRVELREKVLGDSPGQTEAQRRYDDLTAQLRAAGVDAPAELPEDGTPRFRIAGSPRMFMGADLADALEEARPGTKNADAIAALAREVVAAREEMRQTSDVVAEGATHYEDYTTGVHKPGTYRELLLTSPAANDYSSPHFGEDGEGIIAHARIGETTDAQGRKVLMVEEIQSDLHQQGRSEGYSDAEAREKARQLEERNVELSNERAHLVNRTPRRLTAEDHARMDALDREISRNQDEMHALHGGPPDVPWKDTWEELMVRRLVRYAAEHGFERIALTPGSVHTNRYGTEEITWEKAEPIRQLGNKPAWTVVGTNQRGGHAAGLDIENEAAQRGLLSEHAYTVTDKAELHTVLAKIGKENLTDKLWSRMQQEDSGVSRPRAEGFEQAYDKRLKGTFDKLLKKYGSTMHTEPVAREPSAIASPENRADAEAAAEKAAADWRAAHKAVLDPEAQDTSDAAIDARRAEMLRLHDIMDAAERKAMALRESVPAHVADLPGPARRQILADGMPLFQRPVFDVGDGISAELNAGDRGVIRIGLRDEASGGRAYEIHLRNSDPSTLLHESFHMLSEVLGDVVQAGGDPQLKGAYDTLLNFMGYGSQEERQTARDAAKEERGSHAWEQWLAEGKAPVPELQTVFDRFKSWLFAIYKGVQGIASQYKSVFGKDMPALTDDLRRAFGVMLGAAAEEGGREAQETPAQQQPPGFAAHQARAKEARDLDTALAAYAQGRIAQLPLGQIRPTTYEQQARVHALKMQELARAIEQGRQGASETKVITPQNRQGEPAHYRLVEAKDLITSHTPNSFEPEPRYPAAVQERDYRNEIGEQQKVARGGRFLEPSRVLADTPTPVDGPPLVTSGGQAIVLGGNARSMMLRRAYQEAGPAADRYKAALREKASVFGIDPAQVDAMKQPVLVRAIDGITSDAPRPDMVSAVRRFNEGLTQVMSPRIRAVAQARVLTPQTIASIGELLGDGDASIRDLLREKPQAFMHILERDGVINDTNRAKWVSGDELTSEAKDEIEGMFLGRVVGSGERLQATAPSLANKVERAVPSLLRVAAGAPEADEIGDVQGAIDLLNEAKRRGLSLDDLVSQQSMFVEEPVSPRTVAMARLLASKGVKDLARTFKAWADTVPMKEDQAGLFGSSKPKATADDALKVLFAGTGEDFSGPARPADGSSLRTTTGAEPPEKSDEPVLTEQAQNAGKKVKETQATLSEVQTQHRLSDHLADAAREAKGEQKKVTSYLSDNAKDEKRAVLGRADREYGDLDSAGKPAMVYSDAHDAIMEAFGFRPATGRQPSIDPAIARMAADDRLNFDPEALKAILAKPAVRQLRLGEQVKGNLDGLTLDEAKVVQAAIKNIRHAATAAVEVALGERTAEYADQVRRIRESAGNRPSPPLPSPSDAGKSSAETVGHIVKALDAGMLKPDVILRELGPVGEEYADEMLRSRNRVEELNQVIGGHIQRSIDAMPQEMKRTRFDAVDGPPTKLLAAAKWVRQDLMMLWAWMGTASSAERASKGLGVTEAQLMKTFDQLTKAEKDFVQSAIWDVNDKVLRPLLMEQTAKNTGLPMEEVKARPITTKDGEYRGGFHHASYNRDASQKAAARAVVEVDGVGDYYGDLKAGWAVGPAKGFTKSRVEGFSDVPNLNWNSYGSHIAAVVHYLAVDDYVKALGGLLRRPDARAAIEQAVGREKLQQLDSGLAVMARGYVDAAQGGFQAANQLLGGAFRNRAAVAAFALNPKVLVMQLSHPLLSAAPLRLGPGSLLWGFTRASAGSIASLAGLATEHLVHGAGEAFNPYSWASAREASAKWGTNELAFRWDRFTDKQRELLTSVGPDSEPGRIYTTLTGGKTNAGEAVRGGLKSVGHGVDLLNWSMWHAMDGFLSQWIWHAKEHQVRSRGGTPEQAAMLADWAVHDSMPPMTISELSAYARDRGLIGSQLLVKRFPNTMYNLQEIATWQVRTGVYDSNPGLQRVAAWTGYATNAAATYLAMTFIAHFLGRYLGGHGRRKDEGESVPQWIARQGLVGLAEPLPFGEEVATPFAEKIANGKEINRDAVLHSFRAAPAVGVIMDEISDAGDAMNRHKPVPDRVFSGTRAILRATSDNAPLQPLSQMRSMYDQLSKKYRPRGPLDAADKLIYGPQRARRETNPLSDLSRLRGE